MREFSVEPQYEEFSYTTTTTDEEEEAARDFARRQIPIQCSGQIQQLSGEDNLTDWKEEYSEVRAYSNLQENRISML